MKIVLTIVVSLIVWALTFIFFYSESKLLLSVVIALAGGIIAVLIMLALKKGSAIPPSTTLYLIAAAIGAAIFLYVGSIILADDCPDPATVTIVCSANDVTVTPNEICINPEVTVTWIVQAPADAKVKVHEFKRTFHGKPIWGSVPLDKVEYDGGPGSQLVGTAQHGHKGYFKYTVSCKLKGGQTNKQDPMIDIPRP